MTTDLLTELDLTIEALEAAIPANPKSPQNVRMAAQLESEVVRYFGQVAAMVPKEELGRIYKRYAGETSVSEGGAGLGNFGHMGRTGEIGGSGEGGGGGEIAGEGGGGEGQSDRAIRASASYKPATRESQQAGEANEGHLAKAIGGKQATDNKPFDVIKGNHAIEVKTIVGGKNDKITMHPDALARKIAMAKADKLTPHTVVFDNRSNEIYYKAGVGSFRLTTMEKVGSLSALGGKFK